MKSIDLASASPEHFTFRTFRAYRNVRRAARAMQRNHGKIRIMNLTGITGDSRDVYFVVSFAGNYHDERKPKELRRRNRARVISTPIGEVAK